MGLAGAEHTRGGGATAAVRIRLSPPPLRKWSCRSPDGTSGTTRTGAAGVR
ncbi:hypothetical protein J2X34_004630 [Rhodococcus sp. BE178]